MSRFASLVRTARGTPSHKRGPPQSSANPRPVPARRGPRCFHFVMRRAECVLRAAIELDPPAPGRPGERTSLPEQAPQTRKDRKIHPSRQPKEPKKTQEAQTGIASVSPRFRLPFLSATAGFVAVETSLQPASTIAAWRWLQGRAVPHHLHTPPGSGSHTGHALDVHDPAAGLLREVQIRILPAQLDGLAIPDPGRLSRIIEQPQVEKLATIRHLRFPFIATWQDPSESRDSRRALAIGGVLLMRGVAQVDSVIIQAAAVLVVHDHPFRRVHDHPVHKTPPALAEGAGIERPAAPADRMPRVPAEPFVIGRIDRRTEPVDIDQRNQSSLLVLLLFRLDPRRKLPAHILRLDHAEPSRPLRPARADQQRLVPVLHVHGIPAVRAASVTAFVVHRRDL